MTPVTFNVPVPVPRIPPTPAVVKSVLNSVVKLVRLFAEAAAVHDRNTASDIPKCWCFIACKLPSSARMCRTGTEGVKQKTLQGCCKLFRSYRSFRAPRKSKGYKVRRCPV